MENPRHFGPITCICVDRKRSWLAVGTSTGVLCLWDKRFGLLLKTWHVGTSVAGKSVRVHQCVVHPSKGRGKWIMVAVGASRKSMDRTSTNLVEVWDIENACLVETFVSRVGSALDPNPEVTAVNSIEAELSPAAAIEALVRSRQNVNDPPERQSSRHTNEDMIPSPAPNVRAMLIGIDFGGFMAAHRSDLVEIVSDPNTSSRASGKGFMVTGSEDKKLRLWDLTNLDRTTVLSGLESENEKPSYRSVHLIIFKCIFANLF